MIFDKNAGTEYAMTDFLSAFGFTETEHFESDLASEIPTDINDSVTLNIGHQTTDGEYDAFAVVIRGVFSRHLFSEMKLLGFRFAEQRPISFLNK